MANDLHIEIDGHSFDLFIDYFSFGPWHEIGNMEALAKLTAFKKLQSASFSGTNLNDEGLHHVTQAAKIKSLDLQDTHISNQGLRFLERLPKLRYLRLKENTQLTNECIPYLLKLQRLVDLQIHETSITQEGLQQLAAMQNLQNICADDCNLDDQDDRASFNALLSLSARMPRCAILIKGRGEFRQGQFDGTWHKKTPFP